MLSRQKLAPSFYGFQIWIGEPLCKNNKLYTFYCTDKAECEDWVSVIQNPLR